MKKRISIILLFFIPFSFISAQDNTIIDNLLNSKEAQFSMSALLVLQSVEKIGIDASEEDAIQFLKEKKWINKNKEGLSKITLGEICYLLMKAYELKGGIAWSIAPNPRAATRELRNRNAIYSKDKTPYRKVSGEEVLNLIGWMLNYQEKNKLEEK